jgi:hypothetical protein
LVRISGTSILFPAGGAPYTCWMRYPKEMSDEAWERAAVNTLKAVMRWRGVTTATLAARMTDDGSAVSAGSLRNKLSRGTFTAGFFLRALGALGCSPGDLGHLIAFSTGNLMAEPDDFPAKLSSLDEKVTKPRLRSA